MRALPIPNTGDAFNGKTPGETVYSICKVRHICIRCKARWVEPNVILCDPCHAAVNSYNQTRQRKSDPGKKRDPNPRFVEVVIARELRGTGLIVSLLSDIGKLLTVHRLDTVDIRDVRSGGEATLTQFRDGEPAPKKTPKSVA